MIAAAKVSKLVGGVPPSKLNLRSRRRQNEAPQRSQHAEEDVKSDTDCPPNSCIPNNAKTTMKRKRRKSRLMMDFMEFRRETTRFLRGAQYLERKRRMSAAMITTPACPFRHLKQHQSTLNAALVTDVLGDFEDAEKS